MAATLVTLYSVLFINRDNDKMKTVAFDANENALSENVSNTILCVFGLYTMMKYVKGHIYFNGWTIVIMTFSYILLQIVTILNFDLWGTLILLCYIIMATNWIPKRQMSPNNKAVLITGCDRGIGFNLAKHLDHLGFHVFAGFLDIDGKDHDLLVQGCSDRLRTIQMDVSKPRQVEEAASKIATQVTTQGLKFWGIVNNAGICFIGNVEMMPSDDIYKVMAVNYFGPVNVCKAFLPLLRSSRGRLVNVASNAGLVPVPLMGVYCASKSALSTMSEVWRYELRRWGIKVTTIIPSGYKTGIIAYDKAAVADRWWSKASDTVQRDYGRDCFNIKFKQKNHDQMLTSNFSEILDNITDSLLSFSPQSYYYNGFLARSLPFLYLHLPSFIGDPIMHLLTDWYDFQPDSLTHIRESKAA